MGSVKFLINCWICACLASFLGPSLYELVKTQSSSDEFRNDMAYLLDAPPTIRKKYLRSLHQPHVTTTTIDSATETMHIVQGMNGNKTGFIDQWEVHLKSILLNAPLDHALHVHILANQDSVDAVYERIHKKLGIVGSLWRNPITISVYNVDSKTQEWTSFLQAKIRENNQLDERVSLGGYYRLLAYKVLLADEYRQSLVPINAVVYIDSDVIVLTNLNDLWPTIVENTTVPPPPAQQQQEQVLWKWSRPTRFRGQNSGFVIMYLQRFAKFWELLDQLEHVKHGGDQSLLIAIATAYPQYVGVTPEEWDVHLGHDWREAPHQLHDVQEKVAMLHFTGKAASGSFFGHLEGRNNAPHQHLASYCGRTEKCKDQREAVEKFERTWDLVDYYIRIPWHWVRYFGASAIKSGEPGHPLRFRVVQVE